MTNQHKTILLASILAALGYFLWKCFTLTTGDSVANPIVIYGLYAVIFTVVVMAVESIFLILRMKNE